MPKPPVIWIRNEDADLKAVIGADGILVGSPNYVAGKYGNCQEFVNRDQLCQINLENTFVNTKGAVSFDFKTSFSVTNGTASENSPWFYWGIMDFRDVDGRRLSLGTGTDVFKTFWETNVDFALYYIDVSWSANVWHNFCMVWNQDGIDGGAKKFQWLIDGVEVASSTTMWSAFFQGTVTFNAGRRLWAGADHQAIGASGKPGYVDNIKVWSNTDLDFKALSNRERYGMNDGC